MAILQSALLSLKPSGPEGFEGLIQQLLSALTGYQFYLAQSGTQAGRDLATPRIGTVLAVECKRYGLDTELSATELLGKLTHAEMTVSGLDVWVLVTSRDVPDQVYSVLEAAGRRLGVDVQIVADQDGSPSTLEALCAHAPEVVLAHLKKAGVITTGLATELRRIAEHPAFASRRDALRTAFSKSAGYESLRDRSRQLLLRRFASEVESRAAFGQSLDIEFQAQRGRLVRRPAAVNAFTQWLSTWHQQPRILAVLGEEGDGKTWAVASWLEERMTLGERIPPVLWIPSREVTETQFEALITDHVSRLLGGERERWSTRLTRWCDSYTGASPLFVVIVDGLNERHDASWWRSLLESASGTPWGRSCALILTARSAFWPPLQRLRHLAFEHFVVPPFSDSELEQALSQIGMQRADLEAEVLALVRKPRYFDLAIRFRERLVVSGDITAARLIYEDWRDRYGKRVLPLDDEAFQALLVDLASKQRAKAEWLTRTQVHDALVHIDERRAALRELETGGVLIAEGSRIRVEPKRLALGLGLLLAAELKDALPGPIPEQRLAEWLEPHSDIDLKAAIIESAVVHTMTSADFTTDVRTVFLCAWLAHRNQHAPESRLAAYFPIDPDAYFHAAERLWAGDVDDGVAQRALKATFARWRGTADLDPVFLRWLHRWLTFVHVDGSPVAVRPEERAERRQKLEVALGRPVPVGPFTYLQRTFVGVEDEGLLRLGRLAIALASEGLRAPFAAAIADAYLADSLMQFPDKSDLLRWLIRSARKPSEPALTREAQALAELREPVALRAAYRLSNAIGTSQALSIRDVLPDDLFPTNSLWQRYQADPCGSGFAWGLDNCSKCIGRSDLPPHLLAQEVGKCASDPRITVPPATCTRVSQLLRESNPEDLWRGPGTTENEYRFEIVEPTLIRCAASEWASIISQAATHLQIRNGVPLRQLAHELGSYALVLGPDDHRVIEDTWQRLIAEWSPSDREREIAEAMLFSLMLDWLPGDEQLRRLLKRPATAKLYIHFRRHFKPVEWGQIKPFIAGPDAHLATVALFFATSHETAQGAKDDSDVRALLASEDPALRNLALHALWIAGSVDDVRTVAGGGWHARHDEASYWENHWGSLLLAERSELQYDELRSRVALPYLGRAVERRRAPVDDAAKYAEDIHHVWNIVGAVHPNADLPPIELAVRRGTSRDALTLPGLGPSSFSHTMTFRAPGASWGGQLAQSADRRLFDGPSDEEIDRLQAAMADALHEQRAAGNVWFGRRFDRAGLARAIMARPDLLGKWLTPDASDAGTWSLRLELARSFYEALCEVLLEESPEKGAELCRRLQQQGGAVRIVDKATDIPLLDFAVFTAPPTQPLLELWRERLDVATSDRDLLELVVLCRTTGSREWLVGVLQDDLRSPVPFVRARALLIRGLLGGSDDAAIATSLPSHIEEWEGEMIKKAKYWANRQGWAKAWLDRFVAADTDLEANGAFRLFLKCVDSRLFDYADDFLQRASFRRRAFFDSNADEIRRAITANEKELRENFLGQKVLDGQVWPWFSDR